MCFSNSLSVSNVYRDRKFSDLTLEINKYQKSEKVLLSDITIKIQKDRPTSREWKKSTRGDNHVNDTNRKDEV